MNDKVIVIVLKERQEYRVLQGKGDKINRYKEKALSSA
jgi:hypothetical protein